MWLMAAACASLANAPASDYTVSTLVDSNGEPLRFERPEGLALDADGNLYVVEALGGLWRVSPDGEAQLLVIPEALSLPAKVAVDKFGGLFITESAANRIVRATLDGRLTIVAGTGESGYEDGSVGTARFSLPLGIAVDEAGTLYVADSGNGRIRKITPDGQVSTLAGGERGFANGRGDTARFNGISGLTLDEAGTLYVAEADGERVRLISPEGVVSTLAGNGEVGFRDGLAVDAQFHGPTDVALDIDGNVYTADLGNHSIRLITPNGQVTTIAGNGESGYVDGLRDEAQFWFPQALVVNQNGVIYVADSGNGLIRIIKEIKQN